jgi:AcrR family transcriptional regulator
MPAKRKRGRPPAGDAGPPTRDLLLDAAAGVFAERGYAGASVDRIAAAAGLSKGTFYWHFDSKEALFLALVDERIDAPARLLMDVTRTAPAGDATAPVVSRGLADLFTGQRDLLILLQEYWAAAARSAPVRRRYRRRQAALVDGLAGALRARHEVTGVPLTLPAESLASAFVALAHGLAMQAVVDPDTVDAGLYGEILSLVYDGLAARGGSLADQT